MAARKNLTLEDFERVGAGYTEEGKWEPYCIFPVYYPFRACTTEPMVTYYQGRAYLEETVPGKRFPGRHDVEFGMGHQYFWHPDYNPREAKVIIVVESVLNVLSLVRIFEEKSVDDPIAPVCVFKSGITTEQCIRLRDECEQAEEFCFLFDHDATRKADEAATRLRHLNTTRTYTVAQMPDTCGPKTDPNDDAEAALQAILKRRRFRPIKWQRAQTPATASPGHPR